MSKWSDSAARRNLTPAQRVQWCAVRWAKPRVPDDDGEQHGMRDDIVRMIEEHAAEAVRRDREARAAEGALGVRFDPYRYEA